MTLEYKIVSSLSELFLPWILNRKEKSRLNIYEADSLALEYYENLTLKKSLV